MREENVSQGASKGREEGVREGGEWGVVVAWGAEGFGTGATGNMVMLQSTEEALKGC